MGSSANEELDEDRTLGVSFDDRANGGGRYQAFRKPISSSVLSTVYEALVVDPPSVPGPALVRDQRVALKVRNDDRDSVDIEQIPDSPWILRPMYRLQYSLGRVVDVMELAETNLRTWCRERTPLSTEQLTALAVPMTAGVVAAHRGGLIHSDIKPDQWLITADGIRLSDWDAARPRRSDRAPEHTDTLSPSVPAVVEQLRYQAPWPGGSAASRRRDLWALLVSLHVLAAGRHPAEDDPLPGRRVETMGPVDAYKAMQEGQFTVSPRIGEPWHALLDTRLHTPRERFGQPEQLLEEALEVLANLGGTARMPMPGGTVLVTTLDPDTADGFAVYRDADAGRSLVPTSLLDNDDDDTVSFLPAAQTPAVRTDRSEAPVDDPAAEDAGDTPLTPVAAAAVVDPVVGGAVMDLAVSAPLGKSQPDPTSASAFGDQQLAGQSLGQPPQPPGAATVATVLESSPTTTPTTPPVAEPRPSPLPTSRPGTEQPATSRRFLLFLVVLLAAAGTLLVYPDSPLHLAWLDRQPIAGPSSSGSVGPSTTPGPTRPTATSSTGGTGGDSSPVLATAFPGIPRDARVVGSVTVPKYCMCSPGPRGQMAPKFKVKVKARSTNTSPVEVRLSDGGQDPLGAYLISSSTRRFGTYSPPAGSGLKALRWRDAGRWYIATPATPDGVVERVAPGGSTWITHWSPRTLDPGESFTDRAAYRSDLVFYVPLSSGTQQFTSEAIVWYTSKHRALLGDFRVKKVLGEVAEPITF